MAGVLLLVVAVRTHRAAARFRRAAPDAPVSDGTVPMHSGQAVNAASVFRRTTELTEAVIGYMHMSSAGADRAFPI